MFIFAHQSYFWNSFNTIRIFVASSPKRLSRRQCTCFAKGCSHVLVVKVDILTRYFISNCCWWKSNGPFRANKIKFKKTTFSMQIDSKSRVDVQKCTKLRCYRRYCHEIWYKDVKLDSKWLRKFLLEIDTRWRNYLTFS